MNAEKKPLGYVSLLNNTQKAVYPMDDFLINYIFDKEENWEHLRKMLNIFLDAYAMNYHRQDGFHFVDEDILVETQYEHYINKTTKQPVQDVRIQELQAGSQTFVEFQNKTTSNPPISIRASNYFGLSINKAGDSAKVSQIWLLAENDDNVLRKQAISNFRMVEDNTGEYYPREINIMFVSLPRLAEEMNLCGELSLLLMGVDVREMSDELKPIFEMFEREYENFKKSEEVIQSMTILEERFAEGVVEGKAEGKVEGIVIGESKAAAEYRTRDEKIIAAKIRSRDGLTATKQLAMDLGISTERFNELYSANRSVLANDSRSAR